jgi:hypothetical protein
MVHTINHILIVAARVSGNVRDPFPFAADQSHIHMILASAARIDTLNDKYIAHILYVPLGSAMTVLKESASV